MKLEDVLLRLKEKVADATKRKSELEGALKTRKASLKEDFDCKDIGEAEKKLKELKEEIDTLEQEIEEGIIKIEKEHSPLFI